MKRPRLRLAQSERDKSKRDDDVGMLEQVFGSLDVLSVVQRSVFIERIYYRTPMKTLAKVHKVCIARVYVLLEKAQRKVRENRQRYNSSGGI